MKTTKMILAFILLVCTIVLTHGPAYADQFTIAIMQEEKDAAKNFKPLETYLASKGIKLSFVEAVNYSAAANMFLMGKTDAMFSGSSIAGIFIMKDLATPLVRSLSKDGVSSYHAVILAPKGSPKFVDNADYFKGKKVIFTALASSGEVFYYSIPNIRQAQAIITKVASHGAAIEALSKGSAGVAIVKNRVWERHRKDYPNIVKVGEDVEENPDNTLIVSKTADKNIVSQVNAALLGLKDDSSPQAQAVRDHMSIKGYIKTTAEDFKHTMELLKKAGVNKSFNFTF
jgi:ABC-type phosphate/phosphonate transport system substrate-binding protein